MKPTTKAEFLATRARTDNLSETHPYFVNDDPELENASAYIYADEFFVHIMDDGRFASVVANHDTVCESLDDVENWLWEHADNACGYSDLNVW